MSHWPIYACVILSDHTCNKNGVFLSTRIHVLCNFNHIHVGIQLTSAPNVWICDIMSNHITTPIFGTGSLKHTSWFHHLVDHVLLTAAWVDLDACAHKLYHMLSMTHCMDGHWVSLPDSATLLSQSTFLNVLVKVSFQYHLPIKSYGSYGDFNVTDLTTSSLLWVIPIDL